MTIRECLKSAEKELQDNSINDSGYDAFSLLNYVTGISKTDYIFRQSEDIDENDLTRFNELVRRRASHVPLQHITGYQNFFGYDFIVSPDVLIPRQDTEVLVELVLNTAKTYDSVNILDMCTGSGCIAVSIYLELTRQGKKCDITAVDISRPALDIAKRNITKLTPNEDAIKLIESDMFDNIRNVKYDIIVSNPPYIPRADIDKLDDEVRIYDPITALDGGDDGLMFYQRLIRQGRDYLKDNGYLFMEMGYNQGDDITHIMKESGFTDIIIHKDLSGLDRVIGGIKCSIN